MRRGHAARMNTRRAAFLWSVPAALFAGDALAWGLYTHVYFAQLLVWAVPLLDPAIRRAVRQFPQRLMAGACLPDLALVGPTARSRRAIKQLAGAETLLRHSRLPGMLHGMGRMFDRKLSARFDYYIREVAARLPQMNRVLAGEAPAWLADCPPVAVARQYIAAHAPELVACRLPLPGDLFEHEAQPILRRAA